MADIYRIRIQITKNFLEYDFAPYTRRAEDKNSIIYQHDLQTPISLFANKEGHFPHILPCKVRLYKDPNSYFLVTVFYKAAFGNDGVVSNILEFTRR